MSSKNLGKVSKQVKTSIILILVGSVLLAISIFGAGILVGFRVNH